MSTKSKSAVALAALGPTAAFADASGEYGGHHMWGGGWGWSIMGGGFMALFWIAVIVGIVLAVRAVTDRRAPTSTGGDGSLGILRERFARGEIDKAEYEERITALKE